MFHQLQLLLLVVHIGDRSRLEVLEAQGADFSAADYSGNTALHVAAATGTIFVDFCLCDIISISPPLPH